MTDGTRNDGGTTHAEELGCQAFGHLASPFVDGELAGDDMQRFETHLPGCDPCRRVTQDYRRIDTAARAPVPTVTAEEWDRTWSGVMQAVQADRQEMEGAALAPVLGFVERLKRPIPKSLRPVAYLAAAITLVIGLRAVQVAVREPTVRWMAEGPAPPAKILSLSCKAPEYMPVVFTVGEGDDLMTGIQCISIGADG